MLKVRRGLSIVMTIVCFVSIFSMVMVAETPMVKAETSTLYEKNFENITTDGGNIAGVDSWTLTNDFNTGIANSTATAGSTFGRNGSWGVKLYSYGNGTTYERAVLGRIFAAPEKYSGTVSYQFDFKINTIRGVDALLGHSGLVNIQLLQDRIYYNGRSGANETGYIATGLTNDWHTLRVDTIIDPDNSDNSKNKVYLDGTLLGTYFTFYPSEPSRPITNIRFSGTNSNYLNNKGESVALFDNITVTQYTSDNILLQRNFENITTEGGSIVSPSKDGWTLVAEFNAGAGIANSTATAGSNYGKDASSWGIKLTAPTPTGNATTAERPSLKRTFVSPAITSGVVSYQFDYKIVGNRYVLASLGNIGVACINLKKTSVELINRGESTKTIVSGLAVGAWHTLRVDTQIDKISGTNSMNYIYLDGVYKGSYLTRFDTTSYSLNEIKFIGGNGDSTAGAVEAYFDNVKVTKPDVIVFPEMEMSIAGFVVDGDEFNTANIVTKAGNTKINMLLKNNMENDIKPVIITAVYSGNKLVTLSRKDIPIGSRKTVPSEFSAAIPDSITDGKIKVMFLDNTNNLKPYMAPYTIPLKITNELCMPNVFSSNMVLQRNKPITVFGEAPSDSLVTISFNGKQTNTIAKNGRFLASIPQEVASFEGKDLTVTAVKGNYNKTLTYTNVVVGDVLYASGQSNMQMSIAGLNITPTTVPENLRLFTVSNVKDMYTRVSNPNSLSGERWNIISTGSDARASSAVMYYIVEFMRNNGVTDAPIGVINCSWGGTAIENWYSYEAFNNSTDVTLNDVYSRYMNNVEIGSQMIKTARLYYSMVRSVMPYTIKSVVWYQGESDLNNAYDVMLKKFIEDYRMKWGIDDLPWFVVQLPGYTNSSYSSFRLKQWAVSKTTSHTYVGVTNDTGNAADIHPTDKNIVGERLARLMMNKLWNIAIPYSGPVYKSKTINTNQITLSFDFVSDGLHGGLGSMNLDESLPGFEVAGSDGVYKSATARIVGSTVVVSSAEVSYPVNVRYGYIDIPFKSLCNVTGQIKLPCAPFRTDDLY